MTYDLGLWVEHEAVDVAFDVLVCLGFWKYGLVRAFVV